MPSGGRGIGARGPSSSCPRSRSRSRWGHARECELKRRLVCDRKRRRVRGRERRPRSMRGPRGHATRLSSRSARGVGRDGWRRATGCSIRRPPTRSAVTMIASMGRARRAAIPPAVRRRVLARDGQCCQAPGCGRTTLLEVHHRLPRARGGGNDPDNLITLCHGCHRSLHAREGVELPGPAGDSHPGASRGPSEGAGFVRERRCRHRGPRTGEVGAGAMA